MNDDIVFTWGWPSKVTRKFFDRMEIHYIKTLDWDEDECQEYFSIQQRYLEKIVHLSTKYNNILRSSKKDGGFNYINKRYIHYEVIGGLIKMFIDDKYYDRAGQIALKEVDNFHQEAQRLENLDNAVLRFEEVMDYLVILRENCEPLNTMSYGRDATFIRNMFFIHKNKDYMAIDQMMDSKMNEKFLRNTQRFMIKSRFGVDMEE